MTPVNTFLKWILAIVGIVAVILVIAAVVLPMVIDPNNYKDEIAVAVKEETGRDLHIGGQIEWSVFPSIGLKLSDVKLGNPEGFGEQPMLDIGEAGVSVKFMPLFRHRLEIGDVSMNNVSINLSRKANGRNNWDDIAAAGKGETPPPSASGNGVSSLTISGIAITNAKVTFNDAEQTTELKDFDLKATNIELGRPFDLQGGFSINLPKKQLAGEVGFSGRVSAAANGKQYGIDGLNLSFKGKQGPAGEAVNLDMDVAANADVDLSKDQAVLSGLVFRLYDLSVTGDLTLTSLSKEPQFSGQLKVAEFNPKSLLKSLGMEAPVTASDKALTRLGADMNFSGSADSANMQNLVVAFDDSSFEGNLRITGFTYPKLAFDFRIDELNLDDYLPPAGDAANTATAGVAGNGEADLSVDTFRGFTGGGDFKVGKLVVAGLTATDVSMKMSSDGKSVRFDPVNANFYGGKHQGDITIDASGERPLLAANLGLKAVQAEALLTDLAGSARLRGTGDFHLKIRTDLSNSQTTMQDLSGEMGMSIRDGEIVGIDVVDTIATVRSLLGKQSEMVAESSDDQTTEFAELTMSGVIDHGILSSDDLVLKSPLLSATGKGDFNLVDETIDYVLEPVLSGQLAEQNIAQLKGVPIPIRLTGNMYEPNIGVDIVAALAASQKDKINQKADELVDKLIGGDQEGDNGTADAAKTLIKGLLGGKKDSGKKKDDGGG
jgi:AsmA protein